MKKLFNQKTPWVQVKKKVEAKHPEVNVIGGKVTHKSNRSTITLKCKAQGHITFATIDAMLHKPRVMSCTDCLKNRVGEVISVVVVHHLIGCTLKYHKVRQASPAYLNSKSTGKLGTLFHDALFKKEFTNLGFDLAVEHQGDQHYNGENMFHKMKEDPVEAYRKLQASDVYKRKATALNGVLLLEIPDLVVNTKALSEAVELVTETLRSRIDVRKLSNFRALANELKDDKFVKKLMRSCAAQSSREKKLKCQLEEEGSSIQIISYDPISGYFDLFCPIHKLQWKANATNLIGSKDTGRLGTRCPECGELVRREKRRLPFEELILASAKKGFRPCFTKDAYVNNSDYLMWECLTCRAGVKESWAHLSKDRKCRSCSGAIRQRELANRQMADIRKIVKHNGDRLISSEDDYKNQTTKLRLKCTRKGGCGQEFEMSAHKIKGGQLHGCDKHVRRVITVRGY